MNVEDHQEGDSITFLFIDRICEIVFLNNELKVKVENECGESAYPTYSYERVGDTVTMNGSYSCILDEDLPGTLRGTVADLEDYLGATFAQSEWTTDINWRNAVEWFEV